MVMTKPKDADEYIKSFPAEIRELLQQIRQTIKQAAPHAQEVISYGMPAYRQHGVLVYFAAQSRHIGLYPGAAAMINFAKELSAYKSGKGSVQFPFDQPMPLEVVAGIVKFRINEDNLLAAKKKKK